MKQAYKNKNRNMNEVSDMKAQPCISATKCFQRRNAFGHLGMGMLVVVVLLLSSRGMAQKQPAPFTNAVLIVEPASRINTFGSEISPLFVNDSLYFSGVRKEYAAKPSRERKHTAFYSIYSAGINKEGVLTSERVLVPGFGKELHEGPADYCEATGELFVTQSNVAGSDTVRKMFPVDNIRLQLAVKKRIEGHWQTTELFPFNNKKFHFAHPAVSVTGDTLVFSSDMDSVGFGKSDLYMSVRKNGSWSKPVNLGETVNTPGNEMFPTFIGNKLLSFASDGREGGFGGLDIWFVPFPVTGEPKNAGEKINSRFDDFGLVVHSSGKTGYFASNRAGAGSDDIFVLGIQQPALPEPVVVEVPPAPGKKYEIVVFDADTKNPVPGAEISDESKKLNISFEDNVFAFSPPPVQNTKIVVSAAGYLSQSLDIDRTHFAGDITRCDTVWLYKKELDKTFALKNVYYDLNKWDILPASEIELNKLVKILTDNPEIKVELGSHTDSRGSDSYNLWLSQKRSESAVEYIINSGIDKSRITAKGYGETQLINHCKNGVHCPDDVHRQNRRTEFKIIGLVSNL